MQEDGRNEDPTPVIQPGETGCDHIHHQPQWERQIATKIPHVKQFGRDPVQPYLITTMKYRSEFV